jgi:hypothetical protein
MIKRREFLKAAGVSAATLGSPHVSNAGQSSTPASVPADTKYPKLAIKTRYSPQRLAFAASAGYEGVVVDVNEYSATIRSTRSWPRREMPECALSALNPW